MTLEHQIDLAKRILAKKELGGAWFHGVPLEHFTNEELRKIVEIGLRQLENERKACQTAIDGFKALTAPPEAKEHLMNGKCECGSPAMHRLLTKDGQTLMCCECYVRDGNPPADWHSDCMRASANKPTAPPGKVAAGTDPT